MSANEPAITHKRVGDVLVASIRLRGERSQLGTAFGKLREECRDYICGPTIAVFHYGTGTTGGVDMEACFPVSQAVEVGEITSRALEGGEALCLLHRGPHGDLRESYQKLYGFAAEHGLPVGLSSREVYLRSGDADPEGNVTEIQAFLHPWDHMLAENVGRVLGEDAREEVMRGSHEITPNSGMNERVIWIKGTMERLEELATEPQRFDIMSSCAHVFPQERIEELRAAYERNHDIDDVLKKMREDPGWYAAPARDGNALYVEKQPVDTKAYGEATTEAERRMLYCHCPMVRKRLDSGVPPTFCYCGAGWYRQQWEGALRKPVRVEVVRSLLKGDDVCGFAIHLPPECR